MYEKIVVAVDGSEGGKRALQTAIDLQKVHHGELLILAVYRTHNSWKASMTLVNPELTESTDQALEGYAKNVAEQSKQYALEQGVEAIRSFYIGGGPAREIVNFAQKHQADLIVLGRRGLSHSENQLLGSISLKVANMATCGVLIA